MEVEFDTRFKHPWSMIGSGPSSSGKTVFTKQVLNKSDKQFEKKYWFYSEWQDGYNDCPGISFISFVSGMSSSLDAYLEFNGPKAMVFDHMMDDAVRQQRAGCTNVHSETTPPKSKCHTNSSKHILPGKGNEKRTPQYRVRGVISQSTR